MYINTFASERLVFEEKNEPFLLKKTSNLTHELLYDNFSKTNYQNFLVKIVIKKTHVSNFMHFQDAIAHLFILQTELLETKVLISKT